jgi:hypothetical protein
MLGGQMKNLLLSLVTLVSVPAWANGFECSGNDERTYITIKGATHCDDGSLLGNVDVSIHIGADTTPIWFPVAKSDVFQYLNDGETFAIQAMRDDRPLFVSLLYDRRMARGEMTLSADIDQEYTVPVTCRFF